MSGDDSAAREATALLSEDLAVVIAEVFADGAIPGAATRDSVVTEALDVVRASEWGSLIAGLGTARQIAQVRADTGRALRARIPAVDAAFIRVLLGHLQVAEDLLALPVERVQHLRGDIARGHLFLPATATGLDIASPDPRGDIRVSGTILTDRSWQLVDTVVIYQASDVSLAVSTFRDGLVGIPGDGPDALVTLIDVGLAARDVLDVPVAVS